MKHHVHKIILFLVTLSFLFTGCSASTIGLKMADQIKEHTGSSTDSLPPQDVTPSEPAETDDNTSLPITFSVSHAGDGALGVSVNQVRIIRQLEELPSTDGFSIHLQAPMEATRKIQHTMNIPIYFVPMAACTMGYTWCCWT